jgi:hypothetical protein
MPPVINSLQTAFFDYVFANDDVGYICICTSTPKRKTTFKQHFFEWPTEKEEMLRFVADASSNHNVWFGINLLSKAERKKEYCLPTNTVWADLDTCDPATVDPEAQCIIQTSPGRYQAIWRLETIIDPHHASHLSKRIAYAYSASGADKSGHDLTQLLRVPFTRNYKYDNQIGDVPICSLERAYDTLLPVELFESLPDIERTYDDGYVEMPQIDKLPPADETVLKYWPGLHKTSFQTLYTNEPEDDWSRVLWRVVNLAFEAGMSANEVFSVALAAKCNKYARDKRPITHLWQEVLRAQAGQERLAQLIGKFEPLKIPELLNSQELAGLPRTLVEEYAEWAANATDATPVYHELNAFLLLSMLSASGLKLNTSYGTFIPNLWGLILGESTLTRKTTAMKLALGFIEDIDRELVVATDGSAEGLLSSLAARPNLVSVYYRDEVAGLFDGMARKDYLAGMQESFTQLYDVPTFYSRKLRKETITITNPVFVFYGGGIRDKMYSLINEQMILSGFIPRFLVVCGDTELTRIRPTGPATTVGSDARAELLAIFRKINAQYTRTAEIELAGQSTTIPTSVEVFLDNDAWARYGEIEMQMIEAANTSTLAPLALPCFERLSRSLLKMAMLVGATRQEPVDNTIQINEVDVMVAAKYVQKWGNYTVDLLLNSGRTTAQRLLDNLLDYVKRNPGVSRGRLMQVYRLTRREMDEIQSTLEDRGDVKLTKSGKSVLFTANVL